MNQLLDVCLVVCHDMSSLIESNAVYNLTVGNALYKYMNVGFVSNIVCKEGKPISRLSIYSSKNKGHPFQDGSVLK